MSSITEDFNIVGSYNNQRIHNIDAERSVNLFEYVDPLGKKPKALICTSGLVDTDIVFDISTGGFRAQFFFMGFFYSVVGSTILRTDSAFTTTVIGLTVNTSTGYVGIDANTYQIIFVDGINGYIWDTQALVFTMITDTNFPAAPIDVCYLDGFFVVANGGTNTFELSSFDQGLVWGGDSQTFTADSTPANNWLILASTANYQTGVSFQLSTTGTLPNPLTNTDTYYAIRVDSTHIRVAASYADAIAGTAIVLSSDGTPTNTITSDGQLQQGAITSHPGAIVACRTLHRRLFLFSQFFTEVWENAGIGTNLPFRRNNSLLMEYGTPALGSVAVGFDKMFFLSQDRDGLGAVMEVLGTQSLPVSNKALDFTLARYAAEPTQGVSDARGFLVKENGIIFYRLNFTEANHTFVYNVTFSDPTSEATKYWHEEELLNGDRHPAQTHVYFNGINYVGDYRKPTLYRLDVNAFTNDGEAIRRMRISQSFVPPGYQRRRIDRFQLDMVQGTIANLEQIFSELDLLTEDGFTLETESGDSIILDQNVITTNDPQYYVYLSMSKDGGQTYGYILKTPIGKVDQRAFRTLWRKLGVVPRGQGFVVKLEFFASVPFDILGASWSYEILPE